MFRMRRYRIVLMLAVLSAGTLYYLVNVRHATLSDVDRLKHFGFGHKHQEDRPNTEHSQTIAPEYQADTPPELPYHGPQDPKVDLRPPPKSKPKEITHTTVDDFDGHTLTSTALRSPQTVTGEELLGQKNDKDDELREISGGQWVGDQPSGSTPPAHWWPQKEHNPVPKDKLIHLPTGKPQRLAKVQFEFPAETTTEKTDRLRKAVAIREAFKRAWQGYVKYAMPHDELWPLTKSYGDSFMGWGATLIDSLDTLWIMDMKDEFVDAVNQTSLIDFTTSHKKEIPMFETVIRLLGGLISAYDVSEGKYPILVTKANELAGILMGAFDTPNRMPEMFYKWAPSYASQQHRSGTKVVLSQLGTLSMEFTRLAQITKEDKYYDAIARVQNALEEWQLKTDMPGLWPLKLDASGCKKMDQVKIESDNAENSGKPVLMGSEHVSAEDLVTGTTPAEEPSEYNPRQGAHRKRQADDYSAPTKPANDKTKPSTTDDKMAHSEKPTDPDDADEPFDMYCEPQGLNFKPYAQRHVYSIGAQADSLYEYMPKMHRLLGGLSTQYESMYMNAATMIREKILYRPLIEDDSRKILFPAKYKYSTSKKVSAKNVEIVWEATHLGCFAGGMFALAAKTFGIASDMEVARQLTDGCVWAYESTPTKIMPEEFALTPCQDSSTCPWSEVKWHKALDPNAKERMEAVDAWNREQKKLYQQTGMNVAKDSPLKDAAAAAAGSRSQPNANDRRDNDLQKRDPPVAKEPVNDLSSLYEKDELTLEQFGFVPKVAMAHDRYVKARIQEERLPPGFTKILDRSYILRPEAIESVFIMWRVTGDDYWRQKGWDMFQAIQMATHTECGNAELDDVTSILGEKRDKMESFWLGETLKYFYLLFSEPTLVSLDDYVLNTEAHPFRVPKA